jgi:PAS domain S-box-containing protein
MASQKTVRILHLEDDPSDSILVQSVLKKAKIKFEYFFADNEKDYCSFLEKNEIDLILSDYHLPDYSGSEALTLANEKYPLIPFVFLSGAMGEDAAIESMLNGATDYVLKNKMERLVPAVKRAFNEAQERKARQKAERELKKISRVVQQSPNSIIITDTFGNIEYINPAAIKLTGFTKEEVLGKNPRIFSSGEKPKEEYAILWETISSGEDWKGLFHNKKKNGELYWESASISPIFDGNGTISHYMAIKEDISKKKAIEEELISAKEKAEESDRLKTAFLHNISHEIRTPMNAIIGFSGFLNEPDLVPEKRKYFTEIIIKSSNQLLSIISDIVSIATIEAGQEKIIEKEINLNTMLNLLYEQFLVKAQMQNITLSVSQYLPENDSTILCDETKLVQILSNLIANALKFTAKGFINFGSGIKGSEVEFFVEDSGIGIPKEMHEKVFERFRQVESTTSRQYGGSGLGLSISKAYVELLGGKIWLNSECNKGTTFFFTTPFKKSNISAPEEIFVSENIKIENERTKTLLVAEDEDSNFILIEELLSDFNITIIRAINGRDAVSACRSNDTIDLVLMDIKMPVMDGYEATKQIREFNKHIPIIAQTAYSSDLDKRKAFDCGCNDFISKPFKKEDLFLKVREQLRGGK